MLDEEIRRDLGDWEPVCTRGSVIQRVFAHDVYHIAEVNEALVRGCADRYLGLRRPA